MKNLVSILVLVFAITFTTQAQQKRGGNRDKGSSLTAEQHATLAVKKMTLALDLSDRQQNEIKPLVMAQIAERKAAMEQRKANKADKKRPTADEMFAMQNKQLDNKIYMKNKMKDILNKDQFEKFEKMQKGRNKMAMHKMKGKKGSKNNKGSQRGSRTQQGK
ncbi:hypothetical protein [Polaribacter staleyi]|uniref:hypothetical protein n=1 Tax=Polaribacter staleyi TaxID=2022337 RepID=UPI0031BAD43B